MVPMVLTPRVPTKSTPVANNNGLTLTYEEELCLALEEEVPRFWQQRPGHAQGLWVSILIARDIQD